MVRGAMANDNQKCAMQPMSLDAQRDRADSGRTPTTFRASGISMMMERQPQATFAEDGDMSSVSCGSSNGGGATEEHVGDQRFQAPPPAYNGKPRSRKRRLLEGSIGGEALSPAVSTTASEETEQSEYGDSGQNEPAVLQTAVPLNLMMTTGGRDAAVDQPEEHLSEDENSDVMDMMDGDPHGQTQPSAASWSPPWWLQPRPDEYGDKPAQTAELLLVGGRLPPRPGAAQPARVIVPTPNGGVAVAQAVLLVLEPPVPTGGNPITDQQRQNRHRYKNHQRMQDNGSIPTQQAQHTMLGRNNTGNGHHNNYHCRVTPPRISAELADEDGCIDGVGFNKPAAAVSMDDPAAYVRQQQRQQMTSNAAAYYFQRQQQQQRLNGGGGVGLAQVSTDNDGGADNAAAAVAAATASTTMAALMAATAVHKHPTWPTTDSGYFGGGNGQPQNHQQQYSTANGSHTTMMHPAAAAAAAKKRKRRTSFTPHALELLNGHFDRNTHPSGAEITALAARLGYDREVVRIWFCNKRQALKNAAATAVGIRSTGMTMLNGGGSLSAVKYYATTAAP
ncbi:uncharacterized protein LOC126844479 [Adelges cooleyi]|uniref:uncharacterized protein LOC126844479 n=1 Tax=Adelges cooleyi TaxID=133065 RepID=UPI00217FFF50|nr:uncharacterized protein LOC126844479 [Adelges cooleyi]